MASSASIPQFASLYVGDLKPEVTEAMLYEIFNSVGPVASIRVCRDSVTRRSLGYGYVNFHSVSDAERALDTLNYSSIKGRSCRIMWSQRDPSLRKSGAGNIYVKNLDKNIDNKALYDTFSLFGNILSVKVASDAQGNSYGYGFVHYETEEAATQAIERVNGMQIGEKTVQVCTFVKQKGLETGDVTNYTNLYIKNFPSDWDEAKITELCSEFGPVQSSALRSDPKGRPFAFVNFETTEDAKKCVEGLHKKDIRSEEEIAKAKEEEKADEVDAEGHPVHGLYCQRAQTKAERAASLRDRFNTGAGNTGTQGVNLYVKNLDESTDDAFLKELFTPFGDVTSVSAPQDERGRCKGFGFVCFTLPEEATKAVTEMHLKVVKGKPLYVGLAEKREARQERLKQRYSPEKGSKGGGKGKGGKGGSPMAMPPQMFGGPQQGMMPPQMMGMMRPMGMPPGGMMPPNAAAMMRPMMGPRGMMMPGGQQMPMMMGKGGMPMMGKGGPGMFGAMGMPRPPVQQMPGQPPKAPMPMPQPAVGAPQGSPTQNIPLNASVLAAAPPAVQKQMIGEKLFPAISKYQPELAGKITGMMLEMDNSELLMLLESEQQLKHKVDEALRVLENMK